MNQMITKAKFDYLWIQFYNNPRYSGNSTFNYDDWKNNIANSTSAKAKLFITVPLLLLRQLVMKMARYTTCSLTN